MTKRIITLTVVLCIVLTTLSGCAFSARSSSSTGESGEPVSGNLRVGDTVPDFTVQLADGSTFTLSEALKTHKAVMINIWGTWCDACCGEMPVMQQAWEEYKDDVAVVCLSESDSNEEITEFMNKNGLALPAGQDTVGLTEAIVGMFYPTTIVIDRYGSVVNRVEGSMDKVSQYTDMWDPLITDSYNPSAAQ